MYYCIKVNIYALLYNEMRQHLEDLHSSINEALFSKWPLNDITKLGMGKTHSKHKINQ